MAINIREEFFLIAEVETRPLLPPAYYFRNSKKDKYRATATNTLPPNYQKHADLYNKVNNKHFVKIWNSDKQEWNTVAVPPYAENIIHCGDEDAEVMDVYDTETGTYKRRGGVKCDICHKESIRSLYVVRDGGVLRACSFECVEELKRCEEAEKEADKIIKIANKEKEKKKRKEATHERLVKEQTALEEKNGWLISCMVCGKKPRPVENAFTRMKIDDDPANYFYSLTCSAKCAYIMYEHSKEPVYEERRFQPVGQITFPDMTPYACKVCGKVPVDLVQAMVGVHKKGTPEDDTMYSLTCSIECALKLP